MNPNNATRLAADALTAFVEGTRDDGKQFWKNTDDAPAWVKAMVRAAHGDMLPDDYVYGCVVDALDAVLDCDGDEDDARQIMEDGCDVYTTRLVQWLASAPVDRLALCDEAAEELGDVRVPLPMETRIARGQAFERASIFAAVWSALDAQSSDEDDE